jgi:hypothetical protein
VSGVNILEVKIEISNQEYQAVSDMTINQSAASAATSTMRVRLRKGFGKDYTAALVYIPSATNLDALTYPDESVGDIFEIGFRGRQLNA